MQTVDQKPDMAEEINLLRSSAYSGATHALATPEVATEIMELLHSHGYYAGELIKIGHGIEATAWKTKNNTVIRIGMIKERPNVPYLLQPIWRKDFPGKGSWGTEAEYMVEEMPYVQVLQHRLRKYGWRKKEKIWDRLTYRVFPRIDEEIQKHGYYFVDRHDENVAIHEGRFVIIDPGSIRKLENDDESDCST